jgi:heptosyltransferase-2
VIFAAKRIIIGLLRACCRKEGGATSFLVPAYTGLGNFLMMSPMIRTLRALYPSARIHVLAGNRFGTEAVFRAGDGIVDAVHWLDEKLPAWKKALFFLRLRRERIATAFIPFDASPAFYWWGVLLAGIPRRIGHSVDVLGADMGWTREALTDDVPLRLDTHESDLHFDLLERLHGAFPRTYETHIAPVGREALDRFGLKERGYIAIQVSAANASVTPKRWGQERFAELVRRLAEAGETIVLPGDRNEKPVIDEFLRQHSLSAVNIAGQTTVDEVSAIIKYARLLVCHDSGQMHIGNAHGTPLIALYGPTDDIFTAPKAATSRMLRVPLPCAPCMKNFAKTEAEALRDCAINLQCMRDLAVEDVYRACREALRDRGVTDVP